nr:MAG TPA: hypothetical protein [Caudoviricetes sp.]
MTICLWHSYIRLLFFHQKRILGQEYAINIS